MTAADTRLKAQTVLALLKSATPLFQSGLLMGSICAAVAIFGTGVPGRVLALSGLIILLLQNYFHWRVRLDTELLPLLISEGEHRFDQALGDIFPDKARTLAARSLEQRLQGTKRLFRIQCGLTLLLTILTLSTLIMQLSHPSL